MPSIYALLVAIDKYPNPRFNLDGCNHDLTSFLNHLEAFIPSGASTTLHRKVLRDQEATRANIIDGFENFLSQAGDGDTCLFFYAGHGARRPSPPEFWHMDTDRKHESIVCWDSRQEGGQDLMDKELSYLVWSVTKDKEVQFVSITDCCHSGSNMRTESERFKERRIGTDAEAVSVDKYLGIGHFKKDSQGRYIPFPQKYIHLAAAQPHETAKEVKVIDRKRGIFSYVLVDVLAGARNQITYAELISRVQTRIKSYMTDQHPVLEAGPEDKNKLFLTGQIMSGEPSYLIGFDKEKGAWTVNAGEFQNIMAEDEDGKTIFQLKESGQRVTLREVFPDYSMIHEDLSEFPRTHPLEATLIRQATRKKLQVSWSPESDEKGISLLQKALSRQASKVIDFSSGENQGHYLVRARNDQYFLTTVQDERPLFKRVKGFREDSAEDFIQKLEKVAFWTHVHKLENPASEISDEEIQIQLFKGLEPGNLEPGAPVQPVSWEDPGVFSHARADGQLGKPTFKLSIQNTGQRMFWVSVLYMSGDFGITNVLMPQETLPPGGAVGCKYMKNHQPNPVIPIMLDQVYHTWGITGIEDYLKIIISTAPFESDRFNQKGIPPEENREQGPTRGSRGAGFRDISKTADWTAKTISLSIYCPLEAKELSAAKPVQLIDLSLKAPAGFQARARLSTFESVFEGCKAPDLEIEPGVFLYPFELGPAESRPQLSVLELLGSRGLPNVSGGNPLVIGLPQSHQGEGTPEIYALEDGAWRRVFHHPDDQGALLVEHLPSASEADIRLFFFRRRQMLL